MSDTPITLPDLGENVTSGVVGRWLKDVGEPVRRGEPVVEIQSDKVNLEIEAPTDGVLAAIFIAEGESAAVGAEIGRVGQQVAAGPAATALPPPPAPPAPAAIEAPPATRATPAVVAASAPAAAAAAPASPATSDSGVTHAQPAPVAEPRLVSPQARRLAQANGVDLATVAGSGLGGAVGAADVEAALAPGAPRRADPVAPAAPQTTAAAQAPGPPAADGIRALTPIRRAIAAAMTRSRSEIPDAWTSVEIDMSATVDRRTRAKDDFARRTGANLTLVAYCAEAVVVAIRESPEVNASWTDHGIRTHPAVNLGIAVAGPRGLVVPVVREAQRLSLEGLALAIDAMVAKARTDKLTPEDLQSGTFTLNNTGALGSLLTQAIPVPGQAGIVTMEAVVKRVVVLPDDSIAIRPMMNATLSFDHRMVDGAEALRFLNAVKRRLETRSIGGPQQA